MRRSKSVSALIEEYADKLDKDESHGKAFSEEFRDILPITLEEDWVFEDSYYAHHLRKTAAGEAVLAKYKKRK